MVPMVQVGEEEWFLVVEIPVVKVRISDQARAFPAVQAFSHLRLLRAVDELVERGARGVVEVRRYAVARLYEYLMGEEFPVEVFVEKAVVAWSGLRRRNACVPVHFIVEIADTLWKKTKNVEARATLETRSLKGRWLRSRGPAIGGREEALIGGARFYRVIGFYSTALDPLYLEGCAAVNALFEPDIDIVETRGFRRSRARSAASSNGYYADLTSFLEQ